MPTTTAPPLLRRQPTAVDAFTPVVFVVDDDLSIRTAIGRLLQSVGYAFETYGAGNEFLRRAEHGATGCVLLDVRMPDVSGIEVQQLLNAGGNDIPVIFVTGYADVSLTVRAMKAGALDVLTKPIHDQVLLDAVHGALEHGRRRWAARVELQQCRRCYETLTPRERQVMQLVASGLRNKQVADVLGAAEKTIKVHRGQVMHKMQADTFAHLLRMADRLGLPSGR